jgi:alkylhydroperoxidase family enzyme
MEDLRHPHASVLISCNGTPARVACERERAALAWTEALTLLKNADVPDDVFVLARAQFSEEDLVNLTLAIVAINGANRINVAFRAVPGSYRPRVRTDAE